MTQVEGLAEAWRGLPRSSRTELTVGARRGSRPADKTDAALSLWWATHQLRRGPWPVFALAAAVVVISLAVDLTVNGFAWERVYGNPVLGIVLLIPFATWPSQRQRLARAVRISAAVLLGKTSVGPQSDEEIERLLRKAVKQGVLRKGRLAE